MLRIHTIKESFKEKNKLFSFPPARNREMILIDFRMSTGGKLNSDLLPEWDELVRSSNFEDKWVVYYILSVLDEIPIDSLDIIIENLIGMNLPLSHFMLKELQRIFHWHLVETRIQLLFENAKTSATKLAAAQLMGSNETSGFQIEKGKFYSFNLPQYNWYEDRFIQIIPSGITDAVILESTKKALFMRHSLIMQNILKDQVGKTKYYIQSLSQLLPRNNEHCFLELQDDYNAVQMMMKREREK